MFFSPYFKTVHVHIDRAEQLAVNNRWRHLYGPTHCWQWDVQVLVSVDISITKDKITTSEAMHFFTTESRFGRNVVAYGSMTTLSTSPDDMLSSSADIGVLLLDVGVFVSRMAISHYFCKLASAGGWWKLTDRHCLDCPLHAWRASKVNP